MKIFQGAFINNAWVQDETQTLDDIEVINPATEEIIGKVSNGDKILAEKALQAAEKSYHKWSQISLKEREAFILKYQACLLEHQDEILDLLMLETGKIQANAQYDFEMLVNCLTFHVEEVRRNFSTVFPEDGQTLSYTKHSPVGVVVAILTWNFPLLNLGYKLGPILASGCTCVIKPSELTPLGNKSESEF